MPNRVVNRRIVLPRALRVIAESGWSPASLSPVVWFQPSDLASQLQTTGGSAAAVNDPVGHSVDKGSLGAHLLSSSTARPLLKQDGSGKYYLDFDGVNDFAQYSWTYNADPTCGTYVIGLQSANDTSTTPQFEFGRIGEGTYWDKNDGTFYTEFGTYTTGHNFARSAVGSPNLGTPHVLFAQSKASSYIVDLNNTNLYTSTTNTQTERGASAIGGSTFNGGTTQYGAVRLYGFLYFRTELSAPNKALVKTWMGAQCGITL